MSDTEWTDEPICPHCLHIHKDSWEWEYDECGDTECDCCGKVFHFTRHLKINWTTRTLTSEEGEK